MTHQVEVRLSTSPCVRLGRATHYEEQVPKSQPNCSEQPLLPILGIPQVEQAKQLSDICVNTIVKICYEHNQKTKTKNQTKTFSKFLIDSTS